MIRVRARARTPRLLEGNGTGSTVVKRKLFHHTSSTKYIAPSHHDTTPLHLCIQWLDTAPPTRKIAGVAGSTTKATISTPSANGSFGPPKV